MTGLLQQALQRVETLSADRQDAITLQIVESVNDDELWDRTFRDRPGPLLSAAREAMDEYRRGETRDLADLIM
jgi:hypothetical protein